MTSPVEPATVLVVEDEALLLFSIADDLRDAGFIVLEARNADHGIAMLEAHPEITVLFTDIDMPGSIDGLRLSAVVRDRWPPIKIVITSGKERPASNTLPEGGLFVPKPYTIAVVKAAINNLLAA